ncbi:winged helix-turn-helix transcriptional regulator [Nocardia sp. NPDC058666]|uniref:winged helix-turn-helix transcriptional regulator n=1 Tax=Nocardia sp. NPDC058666 TaxID=3346587 RepID=UPI00364DA9DF
MKQRERPYSCGIDAALDVVGGKWKALILWALSTGTQRFGDLKRLVPGVTEKMLIQQLRELEHDGIIAREVYAQVPPKVEYSLTERGVSLNAALVTLGAWGNENMEHICAVKGVEAPVH